MDLLGMIREMMTPDAMQKVLVDEIIGGAAAVTPAAMEAYGKEVRAKSLAEGSCATCPMNAKCEEVGMEYAVKLVLDFSAKVQADLAPMIQLAKDLPALTPGVEENANGWLN